MRNALDQGARSWRKASCSGDQNGACIEVGIRPDGAVSVRDTKDYKLGPVLGGFTLESWSSFVAGVKNGDLADH
ncbi:DUF397 domain-containing protein [Kitasatospora sp. RB6PN24]|uniref:DUF397 domain-containing protein n=1 Tax=Kitasatospora humi TaxID=2893891 RepID=UPI001E5708B3|nr:DUF397 domain-containing protein [Kitasatospora humi]MCC9306363.1 DUF397 domain-containing protein [Kitasatospora humi]